LSDKTLSIEIPTDFNDSEAVLIRTTGISGAATGRIEVKAGKYSKSMVVLDHTGSGSLGIAASFSVAEGGDLTIVSVQDGDRDQVVAAQHAISLGRDAKVNHVVVTLGGDLVRLVTTVNYLDTGGSAVLSGAFFTDAGQHHEHRLFVDHSVPHCSSDVMYKGALQGQDAHSVWIGDVLIRGNAVGTSTYEINRNLLLTEGTRADSVPNLEIETGEIIGAGHASASGRFDEEQMFYLTSRGIPEVQAKRLVVRGFLAEVIERIPATDIRDRLMQGVERRLGDVNPLFDEVNND
jgi:Fe-S cluster assembly protein SufD